MSGSATVSADSTPELAVVLIARNQVWNVERLVRSVRENTVDVDARIVFVDSASTDGTPELAEEFGVRVIRLDGSQRLTAAAGRLAGQRATTSEYILFLDGDMELVDGWLEQGLSALRADTRLAGVAGEVIDLPLPDAGGTQGSGLGAPEWAEQRVRLTAVPFVGGASLYRRSTLNEVGSFDVGLYSEEEPELALRLRMAGYNLMMTSMPMVLHYTAPEELLSTIIARWRRNLYLGAGQVVRKHAGRPATLLFWLRMRGFWIAPLLAILIMVSAGLIWMFTGRVFWFLLLACCFVLMFVLLAVRRKSLVSAAHTFLKRLVILDGFLRGMFLYPVKDHTGLKGSR